MSASRTLFGPSFMMCLAEKIAVPAEEQEPEENETFSSGVNIKNPLSTSGAVPGIRTSPGTLVTGLSRTVQGETTVIIQKEPETTLPLGAPGYLRSSGIVHRAMQQLAQWKYVPARISTSPIPVDLIALKKSEVLLIQVIYSRIPVPDAKTLLHLFAGKVTSLRMMGTPAQFGKYIMVFSPRCGWKYYEVLAGGLIPAWHLPDSPED
jgi:hypothetical protein